MLRSIKARGSKTRRARPSSPASPVIGKSCVVEDVTVRNEAQATLRQAHEELEQRFQEKTAELQKINKSLNQEISQRTRAGEAQQDSDAQFRKLIEGSIQGIVIHRDGKPLFANQAIADTFGYDSPEEFVALPSIRLLKAEHEQERLEAYSAARLEGRARPERYEFEGVRKDGIPIWLENFVTVVDWEGEPAIQSTTINVTERKRIEKELEDRVGQAESAKDAFERQAEELVKMAESLTMARNCAETADRAKSEFLATMSHELRTPLNAIIGFSEIIKDEAFGPVGSTKYRDYADDINESGHHLLALINDNLDLSKVESGTDELHEENIEISQTAKAIKKLVVGLAQKGNVELELDVPVDLPLLYADERKVKQILLNLLSNAIKFTPDGGKVTLKIWSRAESGYVLKVIDTGIGIAFEDIPKALAPFQQVDSGLNRKHEGTGLGLPLTKLLVEMHGGYLDLQSEVGVGTTVTVIFPAERIVELPRDTDYINTASKKVG